MKCNNTTDIIFKDVVVIGNGPSGISLSYMLSGNVPYIISTSHPDEMLSARLQPVLGTNLTRADLEVLSIGLEGRTTNPISLLLDALTYPYADMGVELKPLIEWRSNDKKIDHVVLGKGPPGGSWHSMDPQIRTLSLGSWMALPGLMFKEHDGSEKRASARNVAAYYERYVKETGIATNFRSNVIVTSVKPYLGPILNGPGWVEKVDKDIGKRIRLCSRLEAKERARCTLSSALNYIIGRAESRKVKSLKDTIQKKILSDDTRIYDDRLLSNKTENKEKAIEKSCQCRKFLPLRFSSNERCDWEPKWEVEVLDLHSRELQTYICSHLVLANGSNDLPNRLDIKDEDPYWLIHDLRSLEMELDLRLQARGGNGSSDHLLDPVLIVGAGLSAADAVIATRTRNVPVMHLFRHSNSHLSKKLPENMYPEYHKVQQMMSNEVRFPLYTPLPEYTLTSMDESTHMVTLTSKEGNELKIKVSFALVLIGSRPDLRFLPHHYALGLKKDEPIDAKDNTVNIDKWTHKVRGYDNLYAIGPLAGDNFVRFLPGGALAVLADLYKTHGI